MAYFTQSDVLTVVTRLIHECYARRPDYADRGALVRAFLADPQGQAIAERGWARVQADQRHQQQGQWHYASKTDFVGNMIDWFSAHYGRGNEALTSQFARVREGKHWAYKPLPGVQQPVPPAANPPVETWEQQGPEAELARAAVLSPAPAPDSQEPFLTFGLERHLQAALRAHIAQLAPDLTIADGGRERWNTAGRSDILARDEQGTLVVIELKAGAADDTALTQLLAYMDAFEAEEGRPVRGMLIAADFSDRTRRAARRIANVQLQRYAYSFRFEAVG